MIPFEIFSSYLLIDVVMIYFNLCDCGVGRIELIIVRHLLCQIYPETTRDRVSFGVWRGF